MLFQSYKKESEKWIYMFEVYKQVRYIILVYVTSARSVLMWTYVMMMMMMMIVAGSVEHPGKRRVERTPTWEIS